jgi:hypothetical protein
MASKAVSWALSQHEAQGLDMLVLTQLAELARAEDLLVSLPLEVLADRCGLSSTGVRGILHRLIARKLVALEAGAVPVYRVLVPSRERANGAASHA